MVLAKGYQISLRTQILYAQLAEVSRYFFESLKADTFDLGFLNKSGLC